MSHAWARSPRVVAHRGASDEAPENTLAAFRRALTLGAPAIELDVRLTREGALVVFHDDILERTTNGVGAVEARTLEEIRALDAGAWFDPRFRGERVPTFQEVLEAVAGRALLNVELKAWREDEARRLAPAVAQAIREAAAASWCLASSFNPLALERFREATSDVPTALILMGAPDEDDVETARRLGDAVGIHRECATRETVERLKDAGLPAYVWTVNDEKEARRLVEEAGAAGVITDAPARLLPLLGAPPRTN